MGQGSVTGSCGTRKSLSALSCISLYLVSFLVKVVNHFGHGVSLCHGISDYGAI